MNSIKKTLAILLVVLMAAAPMSAMAEPQKMTTVTLSNFMVKINELDPVNIDLNAKHTVYADEEENFFVEGQLMGGTSQIAKYKMAVEDDTIKLALDGLSNNYEITEKELEKMLEGLMAQTQGIVRSSEMPFDEEDMKELMESYVKLIEAAQKMEKGEQPKQGMTETIEMLKEMGMNVEPKLEQVELMGEQVELNRFDIKMTAEDMDKMLQFAQKQMPELEDFMEDYFDFLEKGMKASDEEFDLDEDHLFSSLYKEAGMDIAIDMTLWMDEAGENMRMEMIETMSMTQEGKTETVQVPFTMQIKTQGADSQMLMEMVMDQEDVNMTMTMNATEQKGETGEAGSFNWNMNVAPKDQTPVAMTIGGSYEQDNEGNNRVFKGDLLVSAEGTDVHAGVSVVGTGALSKGEAANNSVELALTVKGEQPEQDLNFDLAFDVMIEQSDRPAGALMDTSDKPVTRIANMGEADLKQLESDGMTLGIMAYGALMQTPGIAELVTMAMQPFMDAAIGGAMDDAQPAVEEIPAGVAATESTAA